MEELEEMEEDAGLGNGGLGRLAGKIMQVFKRRLGEREEKGFHCPPLGVLTNRKSWKTE